MTNTTELPSLGGGLKGGKTVIVVMGKTTFLDTVLDKVHRDETPSMYNGATAGGGP